MQETTVEKRLKKLVEGAGGRCVKVMPVVAGTPDRLVMLPVGRMYWIETKAPDGRLRPVQRVWHARALAMGIVVTVLSSTEAVNKWAAENIPKTTA